jgi:hypothetical protein
MPYIKQEDRYQYDALIDALVGNLVLNNSNTIKGHHNYIMFTLAAKLAEELGVRYATLQDIVGTFECCKEEFYRRIVGPHEDKAIEKNGDVLCQT